ncbi:ISAs1 family transposase [Microcoleus sp. FACHB-831]|uniref:ISAs1 family transposase n=1 Tax=Microcoleus sp. FACHB-831 TaxID=2692827 RepID=UPI00168702EF|nr:ISAs1 family transposase [Microcoleus sp. FACHB-831]MBD1919518.1 ISAs1 family transposase [Microcoleus sp. FACHB-831]
MSFSLEASILKYFGKLKDPRIERSKHHPLISIVAIAILAVICGADSWVAIETYACSKRDWLEQFLPLPNGTPSHDTFARVFARLDPKQLQQSFQEWMNSLTTSLGGQVVAIDGKVMRGSFDRNGEHSALHLVSAWASQHRLVLGQVKVEENSNEITAIPVLLNLLEIAGCIITIDAIGCQRSIAQTIIEKKADYILALKGNQGRLHKAVKEWFEQARIQEFEGIDYSYYETIEANHDRIEIRKCWTVPVCLLEGNYAQQWAGIRTIGMIVSERRLWNKTTYEVRYYISSLTSEAKILGEAVRSHWGVENSLHWVLDVTFAEDKSRIRKDYAPQNFALLRHLAINLLRQEKTVNSSLAQKRYRAALDNDYLRRVITN